MPGQAASCINRGTGLVLTLMSIWKAVTPASPPATLKSMSPRASSEPRMSLKIVNLPGPRGGS